MSCFGCDIKDEVRALTNEQVSAEIEEQLAMEVNLASEAVRDERLAVCATCPFRSTHTCTKCGCYVAFRASLEIKKCPVGKW